MKAGILICVATAMLMFVAYSRLAAPAAAKHPSQKSSVQPETQAGAVSMPSKIETTPETPQTRQLENNPAPAPATSSDPSNDSREMSESSGFSSSANASYSYGDPPRVSASMSVEDAYAAIPHRRTVWNKDETTVPSGEREYLWAMFQVLDQAVVTQVVGIRTYSGKDFESFEGEVQLGILIDYVSETQAPPGLADYKSQILAALAGEQEFFRDWKSDPDHFDYAHQVLSHQGLTRADAALHVAYQDLLSRYPHESQTNQDAFYDYHCGADFR